MRSAYGPFLGIDIGTSFIKGGVLDLERGQLREVHRLAFPGLLDGLPALHREADPEEVLRAVRELIEGLAAAAPNCQGIAFCGQMHGLVLTDEQGRAVSRYITWSDQRALEPHPSGRGSYFDLLAQRVCEEDRRRMGNELRASLPISFLFWLAEQRLLPERAVTPASLPDFIVARLCGCVPVTEPTMAQAYGALNLETLDWHWPVLRDLGLSHLKWPAVRHAGEAAGYARAGLKDVPCYVAVGDQQCALAGALLREDELSINISTGSQVALLAERPYFGDYQLRPYFEGRFLRTITHIPAGRALEALVRLLTELAAAPLPDPWAHIEAAAAKVEATDLRAGIAFFAGPCGERGYIDNLHEGNLTTGHLFRAVFESMAENYHRCTLRLAPRQAWRRIVFSGGLAQRLEILRRLIAQRLEAAYRLSPHQEDTLMGLLVLARSWCGLPRLIGES